MNPFKWARPVLRIAKALERIAACQEFLAGQVAAQNNALWTPEYKWSGLDESELLTTRSLEEQEEHELIKQAFFQAGGDALLAQEHVQRFLEEDRVEYDPVLDGRVPVQWEADDAQR